MEILPSGTTKLRPLIDPQPFNTPSEKESDISLSLLLLPQEKQEPVEREGLRMEIFPSLPKSIALGQHTELKKVITTDMNDFQLQRQGLAFY